MMATTRRATVLIGLLLLFVITHAKAVAGSPCADPKAAAPGMDPAAYGGFFLGANGCMYDPAQTDVINVPPVYPKGAYSRRERLFYVNGGNPKVQREFLMARQLSQVSGMPVIGVFNTFPSEKGTLSYDSSYNAVVSTLTSLIVSSVEQGEGLHLRGGSAGAAVISAALVRSKSILQRRTRRPGEADGMMRRVKVETAGSVVRYFPNGPRYIHYANLKDRWPEKSGVLSPFAQPGRASVIALFDDEIPPIEAGFEKTTPDAIRSLSRHGFSVYNQNRLPFEEVYDHSRPVLPKNVRVDR
ncbi:MAG: hypothetical protein SVU69_13530 [Pseudomonadota bacterium]|nr:hypothetical protein [Pseudomonadota bacterium]